MDTTELLGSPGGDGTKEDLSPGDVLLKRFKLIKKLGEGGMGFVWEAEDNFLSSKVALKFFPKSTLSNKKLQRIKREVLKGRQLLHKNLLKYYEVFEEDKYLIVSMELIKGKTLFDRSKEKNFSEEEIKDFLGQIIDALEYLHSQGVIHRDVKPSNIFIKEDGSYILGDFGIVYLDEEESLTGTKEIIGTIHYIPPEAFDRKFTPSYDYYSLGITLYEMIKKEYPFDGTEAEIIKGHQIKEPPKIKNKISKNLKKLIYGLLIKEPEKRWKRKEIKRYIDERSLPFLPKEKKKIFLFFNFIFLFIIILLAALKMKERGITSVLIKGKEVIAYHKTKKLWVKEYEEPNDYSFFDIDFDGKKEVFIERVENLSDLKNSFFKEFLNYKGEIIPIKWEETKNVSNEFPLFSSYYLIKIEKK